MVIPDCTSRLWGLIFVFCLSVVSQSKCSPEVEPQNDLPTVFAATPRKEGAAAASEASLPQVQAAAALLGGHMQQHGRHALEQQQQQQQGSFSLIWVTDVHLDQLYSVTAPARLECHSPRNDSQVTQGAASGKGPLLPGGPPQQGPPPDGPIFVKERRLEAAPASESGAPRKLQQHLVAMDRGKWHSRADKAAAAAAAAATAATAATATTATPAPWGETAPYLGRAGCDAPQALVDVSLKYAGALAATDAADKVGGPPFPPVAALLLTGDYAAHFRDNPKEVRREALRLWTESLFKQFPQNCGDTGASHMQHQKHHQRRCMQLLLVIGNNDMAYDYLVPSARPEWSKFLWSLWSPALPSDAATKKTFLLGLYYKTHLREVPGVRVLCLNTILYSLGAKQWLYSNLGDNVLSPDEEADPAGQFAWMEQQLREAKEAGEQVVIGGHIFPGFSSHMGGRYSDETLWVPRYTEKYRALVSQYSDIVITQAFGHLHFMRIRALTSPENSESAGGPKGGPTVLLGAPAVSPVHGNNPAMAVLVYKKEGHSDNDEGHSDNDEGDSYNGEGDSNNEKGDSEINTKSHFFLADYLQYSLPLYGFVGQAGLRNVAPEYSFEFSMQQTFAPFVARRHGLERDTRTDKKTKKRPKGYKRPKTKEVKIDGEYALRLGDVLRRSPMAFALYDLHAAAGGLRVPSRVRSCEVLALTVEERDTCLFGSD